ncbi:MAG: ATP-binding protein [Planctomycetes bacterium]|nr:ATP-binding protein [Planctomycetota bacterium]
MQRRESKKPSSASGARIFETTKRLEDFEWSFNPKIPKAKLVDLAACHFVEKQENVLLIGPTGVGKSHLAQAIGERACRGGHSVAYTSAHRMLSTLRRACGSELRQEAPALHDARSPDRRRPGLAAPGRRGTDRPLRGDPAALRARRDDRHLQPRDRGVASALPRRADRLGGHGPAAAPRSRRGRGRTLIRQGAWGAEGELRDRLMVEVDPLARTGARFFRYPASGLPGASSRSCQAP